MTEKAASRGPKRNRAPVQVRVGRQVPMEQPEGFRVCPLGVQFYSRKAIEEFKLMEFQLPLSGNGRGADTLRCSGLVVHCQPLPKDHLFRVWIKFLDLSDEHKTRLQCMSKTGKHLCPYCENF